uniref:Protein VP3 n=1 Tax=Murine rotavirus A TaxID=418976 RepID=A0A8K1ZRK6_9REOV|nr:VP3 [Murine rotavirus A]
MKVLALRHDVVQSYADTQIYNHDDRKDAYENAFLISNLTSHNVLYYDYSPKVLEILNKSGIAAVQVDNDAELTLLLSANFTYNFEDNIVYLHDYSYYTYNELRTDQFWLTKSNITDYIFPGWVVTYVGYNGLLTRGHYNYSFTCQNAATDDDIIIDYIYSQELDFQNFLLKKMKERMTTALPVARLSNRVLRDKLFPELLKKHQKVCNIGPRNESMFTFLNYPTIKQYSNGSYRVKDTITLRQERWLGKRISQFDVGQYKNMLNVITTVYYFYDLYAFKPIIYMVGSAPSYWIKDVQAYSQFEYETWDPLPTPFSTKHHASMFTIDDVSKLKNGSMLYIDIRTDRGSTDWQKWRTIVQEQTLSNLRLAYEYLSSGKQKVCCVKMTAMDLELPVTAKLLHHPTTEVRSEYYLLLDQNDMSSVRRYVTKGMMYAYINNVTTENVFIQKPFKVKPINSSYIVALYALSNDFNDRQSVIELVNKQKKGIITVRLNNTFDDSTKVGFKNIYDWTFLPTDFATRDTIITSYTGCLGMFGLSISLLQKATGNNHLFCITGGDEYYKLDQFANHMSISRRSHQIRFSESATSFSGYIFRDLSNNNFNLIDTNVDNSVSGHVYNALIYYRYNYSFDLKRWIHLHAVNDVRIEGGKYYEHAPIELIYACRSAKDFAIVQNDLTVLRYASEIEKYIHTVYDLVYADDPNYFIAITFSNLPYKYEVKQPHLTFGVLCLTDDLISEVIDVMKSFKKHFLTMEAYTSYTYMLTDGVYVANVSGVLRTYFKLYNAFYKKAIPFGQSRMFIPHITLSFKNSRPLKTERTKLHIQSIYLREIKGDTVFTMTE